MQDRTRGRQDGQALGPARTHRRVPVERSPVGEGDGRARLRGDERGRGDVVREVRADRALADPEEVRLRRGDLVDDPSTDVDVGVELTGDDARQVEGGRAEVEVAAAEAAPVDELLEDDRDRQRRPASQPGRPAV